ncbi:MAG: hypothetical protein ABIQ43_07585 [Sphingomonas sp.]
MTNAAKVTDKPPDLLTLARTNASGGEPFAMRIDHIKERAARLSGEILHCKRHRNIGDQGGSFATVP